MKYFGSHNATVWNGDTEALNDLPLVLTDGVCVAVLGPNGAGKRDPSQTAGRRGPPGGET